MSDFDEIRRQLNLLSDEELVSMVLDHDEEQWRPEAFDIARSILSERGISPGMGTKGPSLDEDIPDTITSADLVPILRYVGLDTGDAETDKLALEAHGLKAWLSGTYAGEKEIVLRVLKEDVPAAIRILESEPVPSSDLPEDIAEPPCPKCGSREVTEGAEIVEPFTSSGKSSPQQVWLYHCASCGYKWRSDS